MLDQDAIDALKDLGEGAFKIEPVSGGFRYVSIDTADLPNKPGAQSRSRYDLGLSARHLGKPYASGLAVERILSIFDHAILDGCSAGEVFFDPRQQIVRVWHGKVCDPIRRGLPTIAETPALISNGCRRNVRELYILVP